MAISARNYLASTCNVCELWVYEYFEIVIVRAMVMILCGTDAHPHVADNVIMSLIMRDYHASLRRGGGGGSRPPQTRSRSRCAQRRELSIPFSRDYATGRCAKRTRYTFTDSDRRVLSSIHILIFCSCGILG